MAPSQHAPVTDRYQMGDLLIDTARQSVSRNGVELPLTRLSYELLLALIRAHPRMLTNDELLTSVWTPAIVNPETVSQRVKLLRYALGDDDPQHPRYVARVRGRGYRLTAPVSLHASKPTDVRPSQEPAAPPEPGTPPTRHRTGRLLILASVAVMALVTGGFALWYWQMTHYSMRPPPAAVAALAGQARERVPKSIAVLPFLDLSEKGDEAFFADGMTEEITSLLSQVAGLRVSARTSAFYFKDHSMSVGEIGNALGVANVLEGSVRKSGDLLRVTVQLIRTDTGYHIWAASYDRRADDLFGTQTEIAKTVVSYLQASLDNDSKRRDPLSSNLKARNLYLGAIVELLSETRAGFHEGLARLQGAVAEDPDFAEAWASLAWARLWLPSFDDMPASKVRPLALQAVERALAIDPELADAHAVKAHLLTADGDIRAALSESHKALDADPNNVPALLALARLEEICGHHAEAIRLGREAIGRDPINAFNYEAHGLNLYLAGHYQEAIETFQTALALNPRAAYFHFFLAVVQLAAGDARAALASVDEGNDDEERALLRPMMLDALGQHAEAEREQAQAERRYGAPACHDLAYFYANRGDADRAMALLEQCYRNHDFGLTLIKGDPLFGKLRPDPRFQALIRRLNIPE